MDDHIKSISDLRKIAKENLNEEAYQYLESGADDDLTKKINESDFQKIKIRARRLVDVRNIDLSIDFLDKERPLPFFIAPVGFQKVFHEGGEIASARAAAEQEIPFALSTVSNYSIADLANETNAELWFQLYPTSNPDLAKKLLLKAEKAQAKVLILTADVPVLGNRKTHRKSLENLQLFGDLSLGNFRGEEEGHTIHNPGITWEYIKWLRANTEMKIFIKGIVTKEDALLCLAHKIDGLIVSNHGGRQLESLRSSISSLAEVCEVIDKKIPVLMDGGIRRGTDIFKALALGADGVCLGRAFIYGLASYGQSGVLRSIDILKEELIRCMQLAGVTAVKDINVSNIEYES